MGLLCHNIDRGFSLLISILLSASEQWLAHTKGENFDHTNTNTVTAHTTDLMSLVKAEHWNEGTSRDQ